MSLSTVSKLRIWERDRNDERIINEKGTEPHRLCVCDRAEDADRILFVLKSFLEIEAKQNEVSDRIALLTSQRNALLNAIEIAGYRLAINNGVTLEIVPQDGTTPDGENFVILKNLEPK